MSFSFNGLMSEKAPNKIFMLENIINIKNIFGLKFLTFISAKLYKIKNSSIALYVPLNMPVIPDNPLQLVHFKGNSADAIILDDSSIVALLQCGQLIINTSNVQAHGCQ